MEIVKAKISKLHEDPANARAHGARNLESIAGSLKQFGQVEPLVVRKGTGLVIGGNGRLKAMKTLGWTKVDIVEVEVSDAQAVALSLALNRTAELGEWDIEALGKAVNLVKAEIDMTPLGWAPYELEPILAVNHKHETSKDTPGHPDFGKPIAITKDQRGIFEQAIQKIRQEHGEDISEGRAVELLSADFLGGA